MGGRGANSGYGTGTNTGGSGSRVTAFYDKTKKYQGMSLHEFENAVRDKTVEYIALYDKDGKLVVAGTSYNKGAVAVPERHPKFKDAVTLTHNHPYQGGRIIGGSFSGADISNHLHLGLKGETRAVSNGPNENTYIFRAKSGAKQNQKKMNDIINQAEKDYSTKAPQNRARVEKKLAKQGKSLNGRGNQVYIGTMKRLWKNILREKNFLSLNLKAL